MKPLRFFDLAKQKNDLVDYSRYLSFAAKSRKTRKESVIFLYHPPVITAGVKFDDRNLLSNKNILKKHNIEFKKIKRGGDITAHEPGQLLIYVHLDLEKRKIKLAQYFEVLLLICQKSLTDTWDIQCQINRQDAGIYTNNNTKILAIGIEFRKFFTSHGVALNVSNDLSTFKHIIGCGLKEASPTSIKKENKEICLVSQFKSTWIHNFLKYLNETQI